MERPFRPFRTGSDADLAFAVMVLASYFTTFSLLQSATTLELLLMIAFGVGYIAMGIYGYAYAARSGKTSFHIVYFTIQLIFGGIIVYMGKGVGYNAMVLLPLAGHSVTLLPRNVRAGVNVAILATYAIAVELFSQNPGLVWSGLPIFIAGQIFIVVFTQMAVSEERARSEVEHLIKDLGDANQRLREYAMQVEELTITKERNRLAREIHDGLGHYLTTINMQIQAARAVMRNDPNKALDALSTAQGQTQAALVDVRNSVAALRDTPGDSFALMEEIEKILKSCEGAGIHPEIKVIGPPRLLSPQAVVTLYRAIQEGINNAVKHAKANQVSVTLDYTQNSLIRLVVQDDGIGAASWEGGFGLLGMRERVLMVNGELKIVTAPGDGFRLEVCVPDQN